MNETHPHIVSRLHPLRHYVWGDRCDGWNFVDQPGLSVKMERMPPNTAEQLHFHGQARQFFFILKGTATFEIEEATLGIEEGSIRVNEQQGIEIPPGRRHRIRNDEGTDLTFLLCSQPSTAGDRTNV